MFLLSFGLLLVGYLIIDVLERFQTFAHYQAETAMVLQFYAARLPLLVSRVVPMALLLATALTVSELSAHKELIGMRACGVSVARALTPILLIAAILTPVYFAFNEYIVPHSTALANKIQHVKIKKRGGQDTPQPLMIWYRAGTHIYHATQIEHIRGEEQELSIYELGPNGLPLSRTDALAARHVGNGVWELVDAVRIEISEHGLRQTPAERFVQLGEAPNTNIQTKELGVSRLAHEIQNAEVSGYIAACMCLRLFCRRGRMLAYPKELRVRVVNANENGDGTIEEISALFGVGSTFVKKMLRWHRAGEDLAHCCQDLVGA
jgi:lipopolysaccharide export system permease protein